MPPQRVSGVRYTNRAHCQPVQNRDGLATPIICSAVFPAEIWIRFLAVVASPEGAAVAARVFAPIAGSVADACSRPAVFLNHPPFVAPISGAPDLVSVVTSGVPGLVWSRACPAAADICDSHWGLLCLGAAGAVADPSDGQLWEDVARCCLAANPGCLLAAGQGHARLEDDKALLPHEHAPHRGH